MIEKHIVVSGVKVRLRPYTEKRFRQLLEVQTEIDQYVAENPELTFLEIDRKMVAKWWKRKADILWDSPTPLSESFFESEDFESSLLKDTEAFFLANGQYL
jgi:hypothetical protein